MFTQVALHVVRAVTRRTRFPQRKSQLSGEKHGVLIGNVRSGLNKAWLTVKASVPMAMGMGVRPSVTRCAPELHCKGRCCATCTTEPRQTGSPAVTVQSGIVYSITRWLNVQSGQCDAWDGNT